MAKYTISKCDDGGVYYIVQYIAVGEDNTVVWLGADDDGRFCNVMWGRYPRDNQLLETFQGDWWDIPFGRTTSQGVIEVNVETDSARRATATGGFGGSVWYNLQQRSPEPLSHKLPLRSEVRDGEGLTGYWRSADSSAHYYVRQTGNTVIWFAAREDYTAANVFKGTLTGNRVSGEWIDIPLGRTRYRGRISFDVFSDGEVDFVMRQRSASQTYGTRTLARME